MPSSPVKSVRPSAEADYSETSREKAGQPRGRLLLLIPTTSYKAHDFMAAAERLGVEVAVGSNRPQILEAYSDGLTTTIDFKRRDQGRRQIVDYARKHPLIGVIGVEDATAILAAEAAQDLGLPQNPPSAVVATIGKQMQRRILADAGLNIPDHRLVSLDHGLNETAEKLCYPVVLKPLNLSASRGVIRADNSEAFLKAAARISNILKRNDASLLVERFIPGMEVAMEGLLVAGQLKLLALFDKPDPMDGPFFEETLYITPSRLPESQQKEIFQVAQTVADALGLREGPVHAEFRINSEGVWPLEMAARTIGGLCSRSLSFEAGMSLEECVLRHALGDLPEDLTLKEGASGVMMIPIPRAGTLRAVHGMGAALALEGITDLQITIPISGEVIPLPEGDKYLGFIFAKADTPERVEEVLRKAHGHLSFDIS